MLFLPVVMSVFYFSYPTIKEKKDKKLVDGGSFIGYVLAENHAKNSGDFKSAHFYAEKMIGSSDRSDDEFSKKLYSYLILSGDFKKSRLLLSEKPEHLKNNRLGQFLFLTDSVKKNDFFEA